MIAGDKRLENARCAAEELNNVGFDIEPTEVDLSERDSILAAIDEANRHGVVKYMVNSAGVSPSQASVETILKVDLYGTAILLEEVGKVIAPGGAGVTISSQSGHRMPALGTETDELLATTPAEALLALDILQSANIRDTLHAYQ